MNQLSKSCSKLRPRASSITYNGSIISEASANMATKKLYELTPGGRHRNMTV